MNTKKQPKKQEQLKHVFSTILNVIAMVVNCGIFAVVWFNNYVALLKPRIFQYESVVLIGMYAVFLFVSTKALNNNRAGHMRIIEMWLSQSLALIFCSILIYAELCIIAEGFVSLMPCIVMLLVQVSFSLFAIYFSRVFYLHLYPPKDMLVIYEENYPEELLSKMNLRKDEFNRCSSVCVTKGFEQIKDLIQQYDMVVLSDLSDEIRNSYLEYCYGENICVYVTPKISDLILRGAENLYMFYTPFLLSRDGGLMLEERVLKRIFDVVIGILMLVVLSPIFLITAICVKVCDGGKIIYKQERITEGGRVFEMYKFRSMYEDSETDGARLATKDDDRITPVGKVIRCTHIDELPQVINVLRGDMSLVGPRPERQEIAEQYEASIPEFSFRLKVKAGMTGYAQVNGKYSSTPYDKLKFDITYIENYSIWLDIKILLWTIKVLFQRENAEGVAEGQTTAMDEKS